MASEAVAEQMMGSELCHERQANSDDWPKSLEAVGMVALVVGSWASYRGEREVALSYASEALSPEDPYCRPSEAVAVQVVLH